MSKKVSYSSLLKQAISEFDTSKTVDVKGPMLDPILKWDGQGELPIYKDAASILERYYFNETRDKGVEISESEANEDGKEGRTSSEKDAEGAGTEQAGTSGKTIDATKDEREKQIAKEQDEMEDEEEEKEEVTEQDEMKDDEEEDKGDEAMTEDIENAVIEKLIAEMEEDEDEEKEEIEEMDTTYTGEGPKEEAPKEKKATGPMQDAEGAGTSQAGTGVANGQVPDRKDVADELVKAKNYNEQEEMEDEKDEEEEEEELDVDKKVKEGVTPSAMPGGPSPKKKGEDDEEDYYEEAFQIFKEAIEDEEDEVEDEEKEEDED